MRIQNLQTLDFDEVGSLLGESIIDFPKETLSPEIWEKDNSTFVLKQDVKSTIMDVIDTCPVFDLSDAYQDIRIIGSICTNLYQDDTDIDVHIDLKDDLKNKLSTTDIEEIQKKVKKWSHLNPVFIGRHPIELYIQSNPKQDLLSGGVYVLNKDEWIKGPLIVDEEYNPYDVFSHVFDKIEEFTEGTDIVLGELKRDVIDYNVIKDAYKKLPQDKKESLYLYLQDKLTEINKSIDELLKDKKEWIEYRKSTEVTTDPEKALEDIKLVKKWDDVNSVFKFINRYGYIRIISELEKIRGEDKKITHDEMPKVTKVVSEPQGSEQALPKES